MVIFTACGEARRESVRHPVPDRLVRPEPPASVISLDAGAAGSEDTGPLIDVLHTLLAAAPATWIGRFDGPADQVIGRVVDVAFAPRGGVLVLDGHAAKVRVFNRAGSAVQSLGRFGRGPGEFVDPVAVDTDAQGRVFVFDRFGPVAVYGPRGDTLALEGEIPVAPGLDDGCVMADRIYVHALSPGRGEAIHSYTMDGDPVASFATVYREDNWTVQKQISQGKIACDVDGGLVLFAPSALPELRAYDPSGGLRWWMLLEGFRSIELRGIPGGSEMRFPPDGFHVTMHLNVVPESDVGTLQVALMSVSRRARPRRLELHTVLFSPHDGTGVYGGSGLPRITAASRERWYFIEDEPFPRLTSVDLPAGDRAAGGVK